MKKKWLMSILSLFFLTTHALEQEKFLQANKAYEKKDYPHAYDIYSSINDKGTATWYNMGNCLFELGNYAKAIACWNCAYSGACMSEIDAINKNITFAQEKLGIEAQSGFASRFKIWIDKIVRSISLLWIQMFFLLMWFLLFFFIKRNNHGNKYKLLIALLVLINGMCIAILLVKHSHLQHKGVVMQENISLFAGPNEQFHVIKTLPISSKVTIVEQQEQWSKVKYDNGYGWLLSDTIAVI